MIADYYLSTLFQYANRSTEYRVFRIQQQRPGTVVVRILNLVGDKDKEEEEEEDFLLPFFLGQQTMHRRHSRLILRSVAWSAAVE